MSYLNHKQLLALEQVSKKLKWAVDAHFSTTNHLILASLPYMHAWWTYCGSIERNKKYLNGLLKVITRCGCRLRTIQMNAADQFRDSPILNYNKYFKYLFESVEVSEKCPNIEDIITSPKMEIESEKTFNKQNLALKPSVTEIYASEVTLATGVRCKLRSMFIDEVGDEEKQEQQIKQIFHFYSNIEQIACFQLKSVLKFLPQFIEKGLKDLKILHIIDIKVAEQLWDMGKNLRTLQFTVRVKNYNDAIALNRLQLEKNVKLKLEVEYDCLTLLKGHICNSITSVETYLSPIEYNAMTKFKNLEEVSIKRSVRSLIYYLIKASKMLRFN